jgi:protein-tyrosine-phosphatase
MMRVLFVCVHNRCRSQMAEGFARALGHGVLEARSGGTMPGGVVDPLAVQVMQERGIDLAGARAKAIDLEYAARCDHIFTMGCKAEEACPAFMLPKVLDWELEDPHGQPIAKFREVRDQVEGLVRGLVEAARQGRSPPGKPVR